MTEARRPHFSVVIPVYNRAHLLGDALGSVLCQRDQDFEIIVVDDGSADDPVGVIARHNDRRIRFIRQANLGGGAARNAGIDAAKGKLVAFLDSDDRFLPGHLAAMRKLVPEGGDIVGYSRLIVDRGLGRMILKPPRAIGPSEHMATYLLSERGFIATSTVVVPIAWARKIRFHEKLRAAEDTDFAIRLYLAGCRFAMEEEPGMIWRDRFDVARLSADRGSDEIAQWIEDLRPSIPERAYYGCIGWARARQIASRNRVAALSDYARALLHGAYKPSLAPIVFLQVALSDRQYRLVADGAISYLRAGLTARSPAAPRSGP
jgi:glycosyltransferase involved in cell wall biosynthesis